MAKALSIRARREPGYVIVAVAGEVDIATVDRLRKRLSALAADGLPLVADLDQVSFIDATGLGALVGAAREAVAHGTSLHVICSRPQTRRLFRVTGLDRQIPLAHDLAEVLDTLGRPPTPRSGSAT
jgi:anti-sigma B factor antagonist